MPAERALVWGWGRIQYKVRCFEPHELSMSITWKPWQRSQRRERVEVSCIHTRNCKSVLRAFGAAALEQTYLTLAKWWLLQSSPAIPPLGEGKSLLSKRTLVQLLKPGGKPERFASRPVRI